MRKRIKTWCLALVVSLIIAWPQVCAGGECENWRVRHPEWLWCDDFEDPIGWAEKYGDVSAKCMSLSTEEAFSGKHSLQQAYSQGQVSAGWVAVVDEQGFPEHLFVRWYHKCTKDFEGLPPKMARARYRPRVGDRQDLFSVHCWIEKCCVVADVYARDSSQANSSGWLSIARSSFCFSSAENLGHWISFEMEVGLNTPGKADGHYRVWADDAMIVERMGVDLRGRTNHKLNEVMLDCYWNGGSPKEQSRFYDNFVVSRKRIGPLKVEDSAISATPPPFDGSHSEEP